MSNYLTIPKYRKIIYNFLGKLLFEKILMIRIQIVVSHYKYL